MRNWAQELADDASIEAFEAELEELKVCERCKGTGEVLILSNPEFWGEKELCPVCDGTGKVKSKR